MFGCMRKNESCMGEKFLSLHVLFQKSQWRGCENMSSELGVKI